MRKAVLHILMKVLNCWNLNIKFPSKLSLVSNVSKYQVLLSENEISCMIAVEIKVIDGAVSVKIVHAQLLLA